MASIVLGAAGSAAATALGLPFGGLIGGQLGRALGSGLDASLFGKNTVLAPVQGPRLSDLSVQSSAYGANIPIVYGTMRLAGNIIWSQAIQETATTTTSSARTGGKGGGGKVSQSSTTYSYSITLAIAICEGPIDRLLRVWADAKLLDLSQYTIRIYKGDEAQMPDSLIQSIEGASNTPAYRGLAYVVVENFPMADYGNRIPNFTFEVKRKTTYPDYHNELVENGITGVVMIPGAGEFVYDTITDYKVPGLNIGGQFIQQGPQSALNQVTPYGKANALVSLDDLQETCPNAGWVSVVACWFGTSLDAASCTIMPGVEYNEGGTVTPADWYCATYTRSTAHLISRVAGAPQYGGTPDDASLMRYIAELKGRGYKVALYPLMFMDLPGKPWRGHLTSNPADISDFFTRSQGYNEFIMHYANMAAGQVDAFIIGSELKGLTKVTDSPGNYPAVNNLISLAGSVKAILGSAVTVTYAADWSEYHHTDGGWYHLDPLWACPDIDVIGIDAYFPLTNAPQSGYDIDSAIAGWTSGEGYDWYYTDDSRTAKANLSDAYAWKNISWFWNNTHINPGGGITSWIPGSKKIWFTEYGFPSVDGASNQPNVFYSPDSTDSAFPHFSKGRMDYQAQRAGLAATQHVWAGSNMVERMFAWCWDARPYPYWPDLSSIWNDGSAWPTGHWLQGKLGLSSLAAIVLDLCRRAGMQAEDVDVSAINRPVVGYIIAGQQTPRDSIAILQEAFRFDCVESGSVLRFLPRGGMAVADLTLDDLAVAGSQDKSAFTMTRAQETDLPNKVDVLYLNALALYHTGVQYSTRTATASINSISMHLPIVLSDREAKQIADNKLYTSWVERSRFRFSLPTRFAALEPADVLTLQNGSITYRMRITGINRIAPGLLEIEAVADDADISDIYSPPSASTVPPSAAQPVSRSWISLLDIPAFPGDDADKAALRYGACGLSANWTGAALYRSDDNGSNYNRIDDLPQAAVMGYGIDVLGDGACQQIDRVNTIQVALTGSGELQSINEAALLNGGNAALLGNEIIQFGMAELVEPHTYRLSYLLRGRLGTEWATGMHAVGERFIVLDGSVKRQFITLSALRAPRLYKAVTYGDSLSNTDAQSFTCSGVSLKPYSPVHIQANRDNSGNIGLSWVRRTRMDGGMQDYTDIPLNEVFEKYEVDILSGGTVLRTLTGLSAPGATYSASQQMTDFGALQTSLSINVYQLSDRVGRGYPGIATV